MPETIDIGLWLLGALALAGFVAGFIDAVAGGGGIIALPALLLAGVPASMALGTLKFQATAGSFSAALTFLRQGVVNPRRIRVLLAIVCLASIIGAVTVQSVDPSFLESVVPILLVAIAIYLIFARGAGQAPSKPRLHPLAFNSTIGPALGFYDGFFGPGTGTFWAIAFVLGQGQDLVTATAHTKVVNFLSNVGALVTFILGGKVLWQVGIAMGLGQLLGARLGARLVIRRGVGLVRPFVAIMSLIVTARIIWQNPDSWLHQAIAALWNAAVPI